jgi:prepilin-type processing-associated H-X9-DG protein
VFEARTDYASNGGRAIDPRTGNTVTENTLDGFGPGPPTLAAGDKPSFWTVDPYNKKWVGVIYQRSELRIADITNGTSNTYLGGEKYVNPTDYFTGWDPGDDSNMYTGAQNDTNRQTVDPPLRDTRGYQSTLIFGSAHVGGCNMLYCDGRVEIVAYDIDPAVHLRAGDRR